MVVFAEKSVTGRQEINQDSCLVFHHNEEVYFFGVADGMGSRESGQLASRLALESAAGYLKKHVDNGLYHELTHEAGKIIRRLYYASHMSICEAVEKSAILAGMATTMCAGIIYQNRLVLGNIGSNCCFLLTGQELRKLTVDHTRLQLIRDRNEANPDTGVVKRYGNIVTRFINDTMFEPDVFPEGAPAIELSDNDVLLFCSDGLIIDKTDDAPEYIRQILTKYRLTPRLAAEKLIHYAITHGAEDNVTALVIHHSGHSERGIRSMVW